MTLRRVLIANRGEIAVRIIRACQALGIETVVTVSDADRDSLPARPADRSLGIGPARAASSYLNVGAVVTAAVGSGCDAIHPGYGFLAENAGTVEFIVDQDRDEFFFLEVNTRIQVEHPVTEALTGVDLVQEQLRVAAGEPLRLDQAQVRLTGHAIECRINAEAAAENFRPSPGRIFAWKQPEHDHVRVDTHCATGYLVPPHYDSLLAKLIVTGVDRAEAVARMQAALDEFAVDGIDTTLPFLRSLLQRPEYIAGTVNTRWVETVLAEPAPHHRNA